MSSPRPETIEEKYAGLLDKLVLAGVIILAAAFALYIAGVVPRMVGPETVMDYWHLSAGEFVSQTGSLTGWSWAGYLGKGDILSLASIAYLTSVTMVCFIPLLFWLIKKKDKVYFFIAVFEIIVLAVAASGVMTL
jgi:hypothetical protein